MRFPIYESLYFLNRSIEDLLAILEKMSQAPGMPKRAFNAYRVDLDYLRSHATQDVLEVMNNKEIEVMARLGKQKKAEDTIRDLDDVYFEVQEREEQRRKQGLPSLIGVLRGYRSAEPTDEEEPPPPPAPRTRVRSESKAKSTRRNRQRSETSRPKRQPRRAS
jgi:hypothetical protein